MVVDASALLRFVDGGDGSENVENLLDHARLGSIVYSVLRAHGAEQGRKLLGKLRSLPISIVPADVDSAEMAAEFKHTYKIPYADSFAGSLAMKEHASLLTADHDFKGLPAGKLNINFLPAKSSVG